MLKKMLFGLAAIAIIFVALVMLQPDRYRVERSIAIDAGAEDVFPWIADLKKWPAWSPWAKRDPGMKMQYSAVTTGVGAYAAWDSASEGSGRQTITDVVENRGVVIDLEFIAPFEARARTDLTIQPVEDGSTVLTWGMDGNNDGFIAKLFYLLMDFDEMIGADYETGLQAIKTLSESASDAGGDQTGSVIRASGHALRRSLACISPSAAIDRIRAGGPRVQDKAWPSVRNRTPKRYSAFSASPALL